MKFATSSRTLGMTAIFGLCAAPVATPAADIGWYGGAGVGGAFASIDDDRIRRGLSDSGFDSVSIDDDDSDLGFKIFGGYQFGRHFALEGSYFNLGEFSFAATTVPAGTLSGSIELQGAAIDALGILPFTEHLSGFARAGLNYAQAEDHFSGTGAVHVLEPERSESAVDYKFGLGLEYALSDSIGMRAEAERYRIDDAVGNRGDVDLLSLSLLYRFDGPEAAATPVIATAAAAEAAPPPAAPAMMPPSRQVFSADALFDFDEAVLKPAAREALDTFAAQLKNSAFEVIRVKGHTDRIGSSEYNRDLSSRRAESVKRHLQTAGIPALKIATDGVGAAEPVTKAGECAGETATAQLIACLQPDRRVEAEVVGAAAPVSR